MTNHSAATSELTISGYIGKFRPVWASEFRTVENDKGQTVYFKNAHEAECVAWRILYALEQPVMVRDGAKIEAQSKADALFRLPPIRTKGRVITVERRRVPA